jgi:Domain of unknown function (DUF4124)
MKPYTQLAALPLAVLIFGATFAVTAHAQQIHKWTDENGQIHFGTTPPPKQKTETVRIRNTDVTPVAGASAPAAAVATENADGTKKTAAQMQADEQQQAQLKSYCSNVRQRLTALTSRGRVVEQNPDGSRQALGQEAVASKLAAAQADEARYCTPNSL